MEKYLFVFLIVVLSGGVLFGGFKFFQPTGNREETARGNPLDAKNLPLDDGKISIVSKQGIEEKQNGQHSEMICCGLDSFGIFGRFGENGRTLTNADLDVCHGHPRAIFWDGKIINMYHYHATEKYP
ncbi:MAG: hypothetical protein ACR2GD_05270 [Pyrinomonadaceae bacterium]